LRAFTAEEGDAQHCQRDHLSLGTATQRNDVELSGREIAAIGSNVIAPRVQS
jgi:hypothetical protein